MEEKETKPFLPIVGIDDILAYEPGRPETYTRSELVNAVCEALADNKTLASGAIAERLELEPLHLSYALEVLTGHSALDIRTELLAKRRREYCAAHPGCEEKEIAEHLGFSDYTVMWRFMEKWKKKFPERDRHQRENTRRMKDFVRELMGEESRVVQLIYSSLPFYGTMEEQKECLRLLYRHSRDVADLALSIAERHPGMKINRRLLEEAALLHDIGIVETDAPGIHCHGSEPYICHGYLGGKLLSRRRMVQAARVAERHTGAGITKAEAMEQGLPAGVGGVLPETIEEKLICYADKFYSKSHPERRKTMEEARRSLAKFGGGTMERFEEMVKLFGEV